MLLKTQNVINNAIAILSVYEIFHEMRLSIAESLSTKTSLSILRPGNNNMALLQSQVIGTLCK